jgi:hypothetical protein
MSMSEREQLEAEIAALQEAVKTRQARLDAMCQSEPDLSEAVEIYCECQSLDFRANFEGVGIALRAAYPALRKAYGHSDKQTCNGCARPAWPDDETLQEMANRAQMDAGSGVLTTPYRAAFNMARRIREWQEANNGASN